MIFQSKPYSCGAAAVVNLLRCHGIKASEKKVIAIAGTTSEKGTDIDGIIAALKNYNFGTDTYKCTGVSVAVTYLNPILENIGPVIIDIQNGLHWVVIADRMGNGRYLVIDSILTKKNKKCNGMQVLTQKQLVKLWRDTRENTFCLISADRI